MNLNENFVDFIKLLNEYNVKYVLIGGWAVVIHGYTRNTGDMDFFVDTSEENAEKIISVIKDFLGSTIGFTKQDFMKVDNIIMMGRPPFRIDVLTGISGVSFQEAYNSSKVYEDEGLAIRCIHINELIKNKKASGRTKDLGDAEMLEKIVKKRNKK